MDLNRRIFFKNVLAGGVCLVAGSNSPSKSLAGEEKMNDTPERAYKYRIAFGAWINDMRNDPLPLQNWPAPQLDEETMDSLIQALDVQSQAGFNFLDAFGLFATYGYPPDIESAFAEPDRRRKVNRLIEAAKERGMKLMFGMGLLTWGYDQIIAHDPEVRGSDAEGNPSAHAMCGAKEKAWGYVEKILDCALSEFDFGGVHLESADLGWCGCPECAGKYGVVGYNVRLNVRAADYIKSQWPDKIVTSIPINWLAAAGGRWHFNEEEKESLIELSRHIDCFMDQGWHGTMVAEDERKEFTQKLHCDYGTSGGLWLYPDVRWDRSSYFLPYCQRTAQAIQQHYADGARGCMFYQGPMSNPGTEVNVAVGGRILSDTTREAEEVLAEVIERYYQPKSDEAHRKLVELFLRAEDIYFGQWDAQRFAEIYKCPPPGEFKLNDVLFGVSPGAALYLMEPYLDAAGRQAYKQGLKSILEDLPKIEGQFEDQGRLAKIKRACILTVNFINTIRACKGEPWSED